MRPYLLMTVLYFALAVLAAADAALTSFGLVTWFNGLRWLRVHFITLGVVTQVLFGLLPVLVAARLHQAPPRMRWDIWLALNAGVLILLVGIPLVNGLLILTGGTLVFVAAVLVVLQVVRLVAAAGRKASATGSPFYLAGLGYLLLGIFLGTGLWLGWAEALRLAAPKEVHVHSNLWGFASLLFAGLLIDLWPGVTGRPVAWPRSLPVIAVLMTLGALGLVLGPWIPVNAFQLVGLVLNLTATGWLLANLVRPVWDKRRAWAPGMWHLLAAYFWLLVPVLMGPLVVLQVPGAPIAAIELNGPALLIYGWVLQIHFAILPHLFNRVLRPVAPAPLGGTWFTVLTINIGAVLLTASIFVEAYQAWLYGAAAAVWVVSMLPISAALWDSVRSELGRIEGERPQTAF